MESDGEATLGIGVRSLPDAATANFLAVVDFLSCRGFISFEALVRIWAAYAYKEFKE